MMKKWTQSQAITNFMWDFLKAAVNSPTSVTMAAKATMDTVTSILDTGMSYVMELSINGVVAYLE